MREDFWPQLQICSRIENNHLRRVHKNGVRLVHENSVKWEPVIFSDVARLLRSGQHLLTMRSGPKVTERIATVARSHPRGEWNWRNLLCYASDEFAPRINIVFVQHPPR